MATDATHEIVRFPQYCRPQAYEFFIEQLPKIETMDGLRNAAVAIAMHALDDVDPAEVELVIEDLAHQVLEGVVHPTPPTLMARLHQVLFEEEGFEGDVERYFHPINSYLPAVLRTRRGLPITLALLYKLVGVKAGLRIEGVAAPAHFMARTFDGNGWLLVDIFFQGQVLTMAEAVVRIEELSGRRFAAEPKTFPTASHAMWIARILGNLENALSQTRSEHDLLAMRELKNALSSVTKVS